MEKMRMESVDMTAQNVEKIGALFPNCVTEAMGEDGKLRKAINFDMLRQMLSGDVVEGDEAYEFTWVGKKAAIVEANKPIRKTLRPCPEESKDWDTTENLYIEGDNLEVLKLLQESYLGRIKMIYIDPPYNGGKDRFVYNDHFDMGEEEYYTQVGMFDEAGNRQMRANNTSNPRFHSSWCNMMYPVLMLSRGLLSSDGVIFISIDESEVTNLRKLADEVFGSTNYAGEIIWKNSSKNDEDYISIQHEYILCYVKDKAVNLGEWIEPKEGVEEIFAAFDRFHAQYGDNWEQIHKAALTWYKQFPESNPIFSCKHYSWMDSNGVYFPSDISGPNYGQYRYDVIHPKTGKVCKEPASGWRYPQTTMKERIDAGLVHFGADEQTIPNNKTYLKDTLNQSLTSIKYKDGRVASKQLTALMGTNCFSNPKDVSILSTLMKAVGVGDGDIVLDFFSGSGTTGEATFAVSVEQNRNTHFILVQWPEDLEENLKRAVGSAVQVTKNAIALCDKMGRPRLLTEIGKERIRRAGEKIKSESPLTTMDLDVGFRVMRVDSSNMTEVYYSADEYSQDLLSSMESNIKTDRTELDLLFGCLLEWGLSLSEKFAMFQIDGINVYAYGMTSEEYHDYKDHMVTYQDGIQVIDCQPEKLNAPLIACFAENVPEAVIKRIAKMQPLRAVFRDSCFADSPSKINVYEIFKMLAPDTRVKVI